MRDDFSESVKRVLAERVAHRCSHPECGAITTGPHTEASKRVSVGVAAHITAASEGGPRYDASLTQQERSAPENGIWMCQTHGTLVDKDEERFPESLLRGWKAQAEEAALREIGKTAAPAADKAIPTLPEKLRAPRQEPDAETMALDLMRRHVQGYMRVVRLIDDIGHLPDNGIVNIAPSQAWRERRGLLLEKFREDYSGFQQDVEMAVTLLETVRDTTTDESHAGELDGVIAAAREMATTVSELAVWATDDRNRPMSLGLVQEQPAKCDKAREASKAFAKLIVFSMRRAGMK